MTRLTLGLLLILVSFNGCAAISAISPFSVPEQWEPTSAK
ncbi:hypothetical protein VT03_11400 [Planctomyces sp. SH-PL14]|nr:hypothetical protein VT03_11400 [Planctomyces sp. SH-PL14]